MKETYGASNKRGNMWHFRFLGNLSAERDGIILALAPRKYTALLSLLVLHPSRRWTRDELVALFWPDADDEIGRAALRTALSTLRKMFGPGVLAATGSSTITVCSECFTTDVARWISLLEKADRVTALPEQEASLLNDALTLYQGPLLPGIYDDWVVTERERLKATHERAQNRCDVMQKSAARASERLASEERSLRKTDGPLLLCLPLYNTNFVGRPTELEQIADLVSGSLSDHTRLITLTGPGGIGKTRVGVEVAKNLANRFSGAVCFVPLAALTSGEEIGVALVEALQMEGTGGFDPVQQAVFRLDDLGPSLLLLDNMEQLVDAGAASVVRTLLACLPQVTILATSRRLLGVEGEHEYPLAPLDIEHGEQLFCQHARAARPNYGDCNGETLRALCQQLEGIPLAIELCAPWVRVLTDDQMLEHLQSRFSLLTSRRRDIPSRHRSLHAALDWCCPTDPDLLQFFASISVFRGGFTLEAANAVGGINALDHLASLREQSLVLADAPPTAAQYGMRFRMLETIREFAGEKLTSDVEKTARRRSLAYFKELACHLAPCLSGDDTTPFFNELEAESANFRVAIEWGLGDTPESVLLAFDLINELRWFWSVRGHRLPFDEWRRVACERRNELAEPHRTFLALQYAAYDAPEAQRERLLRDSLQQFEAFSDLNGIIHAHEHLADFCRNEHRYEEMETEYRVAATLRRDQNDRRGYGYGLANLAGAFCEMGRVAEARTLWTECREIAVELGDVGSVAVLDRAEAGALFQEGKVDSAINLLENAANTFRHKGETRQLIDTLCNLGRAQNEAHQSNAAQNAWEEALALARQCGDAGWVQFLSEQVFPSNPQK